MPEPTFRCTVCQRTFPVASVAESHCAAWKDADDVPAEEA